MHRLLHKKVRIPRESNARRRDKNDALTEQYKSPAQEASNLSLFPSWISYNYHEFSPPAPRGRHTLTPSRRKSLAVTMNSVIKQVAAWRGLDMKGYTCVLIVYARDECTNTNTMYTNTNKLAL